MMIYDFDEIKAAGDCLAYCLSVLNLTPQGKSGGWTSFNNPWRPGSDSGAFNVTREGYKDHVSGESGSILDLCANAHHDGDLFAASEELGKLYGLKPKIRAKQKRRFVCAYDYTDELGILTFQVVRWEPKDFSQRRPDPAKEGEWLYNIEGVRPLLYRLPDIAEKKTIFIVGGEKDADNLWKLDLPATTNAGGEGHWKPEHSEQLRGKRVVIIPDNDEPGRRHADQVIYALRGVAAEAKIVTLPATFNEKPVKDVTNWIEAGGTREQLLALVKTTAAPKPADVPAPAVTQAEISAAKKANKFPFSNYIVGSGVDERGKDRKEKQPRKVIDMCKDTFTRFWSFPRRIGSTLFDHDRNTGLIRNLESHAALFAWMAEKSGHPIEWARNIEGCITAEQFYAALSANAMTYNLVSGVPNWPARNDVYYTHGDLPKPDPDAKAFKEFCAFFSTATEADAHLLRAFFASPIYYRTRVDRPMWIIDATHGQGSGKTKLVEMLASLYGGDDAQQGDPLIIDHNEINNETQSDKITKRLLSRTGRCKRIVLIDNVDGFFRSPALARLVTQSSVSGMAPYGYGEETRPMDLTICLTSNSANMDRDLISRSFILHVAKPENPLINWEQTVTGFIQKHRLQIIADIIGILEKGPKFEFSPVTRFRSWEREILAPMMGSIETYSMVYKANLLRQEESDVTIEDADTLRNHFVERLNALGINTDPEYAPIWITSRVLAEWSREAIPGFGGRTGRGAIHAIKNLIKIGLIGELSDAVKVFPHHGNLKSRGLMWNHDQYLEGKNVRMIGHTSDGAIKEINHGD